MSRQIQDQNFLVWEVFPSGGPQGFSDDPYVIFHCLTQRDLRPRRIELGEDEGEAQRLVAHATDEELLGMLQRSAELP
ncbi:MAG TPA: hypothetical protein VK939_06840 [Longimicrobiales bacterium]|nr:hypothetical protein [Longimicrobiales bacterium]